MLKCPYCGSTRLEAVGGENGDPFDRKPRKTVCLDCKRTIGNDFDILDDFLPRIRIKMSAVGGGIVRKAYIDFPYENGEFVLDKSDYPFCRYKKLKISGNNAWIDDEIYAEITDIPHEIVKNYTSFAPDNHPEAESVIIMICKDEPRTEKEKAELFLQAAREADAGNAMAMYHTAYCYENGIGTDIDIDAAFLLYAEAAHLGIRSAMLRLYEIYSAGLGHIKPDNEKAAMYLLMINK